MNTSQSISNKISKSQWVLQSIESIKYSINKWWYGIISTTCLRKLPFIRKRRIIYIKQTKKTLNALEQTIKHTIEKQPDVYKGMFKKYLSPTDNQKQGYQKLNFNIDPEHKLKSNLHETEHRNTKHRTSKKHKSSQGEDIYRQE